MLLYLAAPIESNPGLGEHFRSDMIVAFQNPSLAQYALYDPSRAYHLSPAHLTDKVALSIRNTNRAVIRASDGVLALLDGCETWREIEMAKMSGIRVYGFWPGGVIRSPVAAVDFPTYVSIEEFINELLHD